MASPDLTINKPGVFSILRALFVLFVAALIALALLHFFRRNSVYDADRAKIRYENLRKLNEANAPKLTEYAWVDKAKGTVQLPVDQAMRIMARELAAKKPTSAYAIATPAPAAAPAPAPAPAAAPTSATVTPAGSPVAVPVMPAGSPPAAPAVDTPTPVPSAPAPPTATPVSASTPSAAEGTALEPPPANTPAQLP